MTVQDVLTIWAIAVAVQVCYAVRDYRRERRILRKQLEVRAYREQMIAQGTARLLHDLFCDPPTPNSKPWVFTGPEGSELHWIEEVTPDQLIPQGRS